MLSNIYLKSPCKIINKIYISVKIVFTGYMARNKDKNEFNESASWVDTVLLLI